MSNTLIGRLFLRWKSHLLSGIRHGANGRTSLAMVPLLGLLATESCVYDDFYEEKVSEARWHIPTWTTPEDGTFIGQTQFRCSQDADMPRIVEGAAEIALETYNPTGKSFYGTDLISNRVIKLGRGVVVSVRARMAPSAPPGIVGGIFLYPASPGPEDKGHFEIDVELLSRHQGRFWTNIYHGDAGDEGNPVAFPFAAGSIHDYHVYEIRWLPGKVSWLVDGVPIRSAALPEFVSKIPMRLHLNCWAPGSNFKDAYDPRLKWTASPAANRIYAMHVDYVKIGAI